MASPRVIAIQFDGLRADALSEERTPNLLAAAERGAWFQNHRSVFPTSTRGLRFEPRHRRLSRKTRAAGQFALCARDGRNHHDGPLRGSPRLGARPGRASSLAGHFFRASRWRRHHQRCVEWFRLALERGPACVSDPSRGGASRRMARKIREGGRNPRRRRTRPCALRVGARFRARLRDPRIRTCRARGSPERAGQHPASPGRRRGGLSRSAYGSGSAVRRILGEAENRAR